MKNQTNTERRATRLSEYAVNRLWDRFNAMLDSARKDKEKKRKKAAEAEKQLK